MFSPHGDTRRRPKEHLSSDKWRFVAPDSLTSPRKAPGSARPRVSSQGLHSLITSTNMDALTSTNPDGPTLLIAEANRSQTLGGTTSTGASNVGADADPDVDCVHSARLFRPAPPLKLPVPPIPLRSTVGGGGKRQSTFHKSPFRKPPPPKPLPPSDEYRPLELVAPEDQCIPPPSPGLSGRRRSSDLTRGVATPNPSAGRTLEATVSPTRRNGRIVFSEGTTSYILDLTTKAIVVCRQAFAANAAALANTSRKLKGVGHSVGNTVSYQHQYNGDRTLEAVNIGPPVTLAHGAGNRRRSNDSSSHSLESPSMVGLSRSASMVSGSPTPVGGSFVGAMSLEMRGSTLNMSDQFQSDLDSHSNSASKPSAAAAAAQQMPTEGWELFVQLEKLRGNRMLLTAAPADLVRMVDAACSPAEGQRLTVADITVKSPQEECLKSVEASVPKSGPLMRPRAQEWAARHSITDVLHLGSAALAQVSRAEDRTQLLGIRSVFEEPPLRFKSQDIDSFVAPPPAALDGRRVSQAGLAAAAYGAWYIRPERREKAFDEGRSDVKERQEQSAAALRDAHRATRAGSASSQHGSFRDIKAMRALTSRIERVQARDHAAISELLAEAAAATQQSKGSPATGTGSPRAAGETPPQTPFGSPAKTSSPSAEALLLSTPASAFTASPAGRPTTAARNGKIQPGRLLSGPIRLDPAPPPVVSRRHRLERQVYLGKNWALSQGEVLTARNAPQEQDMDEENKAFVAQFIMRTKPKITVNTSTAAAGFLNTAASFHAQGGQGGGGLGSQTSFTVSSREPSPTME